MFADKIANWSNGNSGFLSLLIFLTALILGWVGNIFQSFKTKPNFKIELNPGPNFCSTFEIGEKYHNYEVHQTAISLYLNVSNIGNAPASIKNIAIGFHWQILPTNFPLLKVDR